MEVYLGSYTKGRAKELVEHCGATGARNAWRIQPDKGLSQRPLHQHALHTKVYSPKTNVPAKDLEVETIRWENDVRS